MKVTGLLHSAFPTRYWSSDLGPGRSVILFAQLPDNLAQATHLHQVSRRTHLAHNAHRTAAAAVDAREQAKETDHALRDPDLNYGPLDWRVIEMPAGRLINWEISPDASSILASVEVNVADQVTATQTWRVDVASGQRCLLLDTDAAPSHQLGLGKISPDGDCVLLSCERLWRPNQSMALTTEVMDLETLERYPVWPQHDYWVEPIWVDEHTLAATSDDQGRGAVWCGGLQEPTPRRVAGGPESADHYVNLERHRDGGLISLRSSIDMAPHPVHLEISNTNATVRPIPSPADPTEQPGYLEEITTTAADGTTLRAWLRLPEGEGPHPLLVLAHGGPWGSWNAFTYRWNPSPFVAAGFAVLLPDPAISTGYGQAMIDRGQLQLGGTPYTDIMALTDATVSREDIDQERQAFGGGSYGGYMANWVAGHTGDRFKAIVTHASLWNNTSMGCSTDNAEWDLAMRQQSATYSPHLFAEQITAPMLVIHGDQDYRVPIGQALELWHALHVFASTPPAPDGSLPHRYLYFPDEGHWIESRGNAWVWYCTFIDFLRQHVLDETVRADPALG